MIFKFSEMLYEMYGNGYEDAIECFFENIHRNNNEDYSLDELFIAWGEYLKSANAFEKTL